MTFAIVDAPQSKQRHITIYKPIAGWKAIEYWWNPGEPVSGNELPEDDNGFWEPWDTSKFAFDTAKEAWAYALQWAMAKDLPLINLDPTH